MNVLLHVMASNVKEEIWIAVPSECLHHIVTLGCTSRLLAVRNRRAGLSACSAESMPASAPLWRPRQLCWGRIDDVEIAKPEPLAPEASSEEAGISERPESPWP